MKRFYLLVYLLAAVGLARLTGVQAQTTLATFEDGMSETLTFDNTAWYEPSVFKHAPAVYDNPDRSGINSSLRCVGATNVADASWWGNFLVLKLAAPVVITEQNRYLTFQCYRSAQPKEMRIGFNGYDESNQIWIGRTSSDARWQTMTVDLGAKFMGQSLSSLYIVLSCNWSAPSSGWGEASYYFDNFTLASAYVDLSTSYQTIEDFGASDCWLGEVVGKNWEEKQKLSMAQKLFSKEFDASGNPLGIGLSTWRVNLGAGTANIGDASGITDQNRRTECFLNADGTYDWSRQAGQQYFMEQAKKYGCEHFVLFSNTPPIYFTKNGKGVADAGESSCNLQSDKFDDFAEYMATVAQHFDSAGYNIKYISPLNEPQFDWTSDQEGSPWQNADIARLAVRLNLSLTNRKSATKILLSEAGSWDCSSGGTGRAQNQIPGFFDRSSSNYIGSLPALAPFYGSHSYWTYSTNDAITSTRTKAWTAAKKYGIGTMQTEWSMLGDAPSTDTGFPASYDAATYNDIALFMAKLIQCDLTIANVSSWSYWTVFGNEVYGMKNRFLLLRLIPRDGDYGDPHYSGIFTASKNLWMLGNYSRFIRPGYRRIALGGASEMNGLLGSAYMAPDSSCIVCVYVNTARTKTTRSLAFSGLMDKQPVSVHKYLTNVSHDLALIPTESGTFTGAEISLPARSVVTVVYDLADSTVVPNGMVNVPMAVTPSGTVYDLSGRCVGNSWNDMKGRRPGIYIVDGKKVLLR